MRHPSRLNSLGPCLAIVDDPALAAALVDRWATAADRDYAAQRRRPAPSLQALAALRALLFAATGQGGWRVARGRFGKPFIEATPARPAPAVSLSHTPGLIAVAAAWDSPIGVDVERRRPRDVAALAAVAFGSAEQAEVAAEGQAAFYRIWTLREAMGKATGDGLALALNRQDLAEAVVSGATQRRGRAMRDWQLFHTPVEPGRDLALAWIGEAHRGPPQWIDLAPLRRDTPCEATTNAPPAHPS